MAENGEYYYYIPDTGEIAQYVTELQNGDIEGQALGGQEQANPWWIGAVESSDTFNALPWLVGLAGLGLVAVAAGSGSDNDSSPSSPPPDTVKPNEPTVIISNNGTTISGTAEPESTVTIDVNNDGQPAYIAVVKPDGSYEIDTSSSPLIHGETISVVATDKAGNASHQATVSAPNVVDTAVPDAPTLNIATDGTSITGTAEPGSTVNIDTNGDGNPDYVTSAGTDGNYSVDTNDAPLTNGQTVTATATDSANNLSLPATAIAPTAGDTAAPDMPTVSIDATGTSISGKAEPGSTVNIDINGDAQPDYVTTADAGDNYHTDTSNAPLIAGQNVTATAADPSGNTSTPATTTAPVVTDTVAPEAPTLNIATDGTSITGTAEPGSTVNIDTNGDGNPDYVTSADSDGNYRVGTNDAPLTNGQTVTATATDLSGNVSPQGSDNAPKLTDTTPPDSTTTFITINPITSDNLVNSSEAQTDIVVTGKVSGEFTSGDKIILNVNGNDFTGKVSTDGAYIISISGSDLASDTVLNATIIATDIAGNSASITASKTYEVDTTGPDDSTTSIDINPITEDNLINGAEAGNTIAVTGTVTGEFTAGNEVTLTVNGNNYTGEVSADGSYNIDVSSGDLVADPDATLTATIVATDSAGNSGSVSHDKTYVVDTTAPSDNTTSIDINPITEDNLINGAEAGTTIPVTGMVTGEFSEGDLITLTVNGNNYNANVNADGSYSVDVPGSDLASDTDTTLTVRTCSQSFQ